MTYIKKTGYFLAKGTGIVLGEPIKYIGEKLESDFVIGVGKGVKSASEFSISTAGTVLDGVIELSSGALSNNEIKKQNGINELKEVGVAFTKSVQNTVIEVAKDSGKIYRGFTQGRNEDISEGLKNISQKVIISTLAIGAIDVLSGVDGEVTGQSAGDIDAVYPESNVDSGNTEAPIQLNTLNEGLVGETHPETGVSFIYDQAENVNGHLVEGVFPDFQEVYSVEVPSHMYMDSDAIHFTYANEQLLYHIAENPEMQNMFTEDQLKQIQEGETPDGYVWHHHQNAGKLELVDEEVHAQTAHTGGRSIWGGGQMNR